MMPKRKIAILINSLTGGGAERVVTYLLEALRDDYEIHLLLFSEEIDYELPKGQVIAFLDKGGSRNNDAVNILRIPQISRRLVRYCKKNGIELCLSLLPRPNFVACFAKKLGLRAKVLISERAYTPMWYRESDLRGRIGRLLVSSLYPIADAILPNSKATLDALQHDFGIKNSYFLVRNPIAIDDVLRKQGEAVDDVRFDKFTFVCVAGFRAQKNHRVLIDAFARMRSDSAQLLLIGKGELRSETEKQAASLQLQDRVLFLGHKDNPFKYLSRSDCFVLPSDFEGFPNALIEAMACGLPIISTDCLTGPRELLAPTTDYKTHITDKYEAGEFGLLVPVAHEELLAQAMNEMMKNDQLRNKYKVAGLKKALDYDLEVAIDDFRRVINSYLP